MLVLFSISAIAINAQSYVKIYDAKTLDPLAFAHVSYTTLADNKHFNTTSDENGKVEFSTDIEGKIYLEITYIGYQSLIKTITLGNVNSLYLFPYDEKIDEVVVTANPVELSTKQSHYKIEIISREEIDSKASNTLEDVLMNNESIELKHDVLGTSITMQGLSGANVKVMIDGVPVIGRMNGEIDISKINLSNIERIEIVEGPLSVIYGSNALAGVINLITKKSQKNVFGANLNLFYQTIGNYNIDAQVSYKFKRHYFSLNGGRYFFGGWNEDKTKRDLSWDPKETYFSDVNYVYRTSKDYFHRIKGSFYTDRMLDRKNRTGPFTKADDQWFKTRRIDVSYMLKGTYKENYYLQSTNAYNNYQRIKNTYTKDLSTLETTLKENSAFSNYQDTTVLHQYISRTSIAYNDKTSKYNYQIGYDLNIETGKGKRFYKDDKKEIVIGDIVVFATFTYKPSDKLSIQPAMRYGYNSKFTTTPTLSASIKYDFTKDFIWRVSYGMGYRAPTLKEMYLSFQDINHNISGNEDLKAEKSHNVSTNIDYYTKLNLHKFRFKLNGFFNHKYDGIILSQTINTTDETEYTYMNAYKYQTLGFDFNIKYNIKNLSINTAFSYIGTYNSEKEQNENLKQFFFKPVYTLNVSYDIKKWGLKISAFNKFTGTYFDYFVDQNKNFVPLKRESYDLLDLTASKTFWKKRIRINAGIKNILDIKSIDQNTGSGGVHSSSTGTQISTGRSYFVGLKFNY